MNNVTLMGKIIYQTKFKFILEIPNNFSNHLRQCYAKRRKKYKYNYNLEKNLKSCHKAKVLFYVQVRKKHY